MVIPLHVGQDTCSKRTQAQPQITTQHDGDGEVAMAVVCVTALYCLVVILVCGVV